MSRGIEGKAYPSVSTDEKPSDKEEVKGRQFTYTIEEVAGSIAHRIGDSGRQAPQADASQYSIVYDHTELHRARDQVLINTGLVLHGLVAHRYDRSPAAVSLHNTAFEHLVPLVATRARVLETIGAS